LVEVRSVLQGAMADLNRGPHKVVFRWWVYDNVLIVFSFGKSLVFLLFPLLRKSLLVVVLTKQVLTLAFFL
jgi:hypothetical protein